jgi:hypothetical protein
VLNPHPENPYCWVPSSKFVKKPQDQAFLAPTSTPNQDMEDDKLNTLLTKTRKRLFSPGQKIQHDNINHSQMAYEQGQTFAMWQ